MAQALEEQSALGTGAPTIETAPAGIDTWVRPFTVEWVPRELSASAAATAERAWKVIAPPDPVVAPLAAALSARLQGQGVALFLPPDTGEEQAGLFLEAVRAVTDAPRPARFLPGRLHPGESRFEKRGVFDGAAHRLRQGKALGLRRGDRRERDRDAQAHGQHARCAGRTP